MNTKRTALIGGTAALLLVLTGCAGVEGQFDDSARGDAAAARAESKAQTGLSLEQADQARAAYDRLREATEARFQAERTERNAAAMLVNERIREVRQSESTPVTSVQERIRQSKQSESEPASETPQPMTPEQVRELKASQVK
jgi:hypothetical protein